jgi:hypothetical protein
MKFFVVLYVNESTNTPDHTIPNISVRKHRSNQHKILSAEFATNKDQHQ